MNTQLNCKVSVPNFPYILPFGTLINFHGRAHFIYARQTSKLWPTVRYIYANGRARARAHARALCERKNILRASLRHTSMHVPQTDFRATSNKIIMKKTKHGKLSYLLFNSSEQISVAKINRKYN